MWIGFSYTASGFQWTDKTEFAYTNWAKGEPSGDYDGTDEECGEMWQDGKWNDQDCDEVHPYVCKKLRSFPYCENAKIEGIESCGFPGMSEQQCIEEWGCCFDPRANIQCFKPKSFDSGVNVGLAAGAAVGILFACLGVAAGGFFYYKNYGFNSPWSATTDSFATPFSPTQTA